MSGFYENNYKNTVLVTKTVCIITTCVCQAPLFKANIFKGFLKKYHYIKPNKNYLSVTFYRQ